MKRAPQKLKYDIPLLIYMCSTTYCAQEATDVGTSCFIKCQWSDGRCYLFEGHLFKIQEGQVSILHVSLQQGIFCYWLRQDWNQTSPNKNCISKQARWSVACTWNTTFLQPILNGGVMSAVKHGWSSHRPFLWWCCWRYRYSKDGEYFINYQQATPLQLWLFQMAKSLTPDQFHNTGRGIFIKTTTKSPVMQLPTRLLSTIQKEC